MSAILRASRQCTVHNALFPSPLQDVYVVYNTQAHTRAKVGGARKPTETDRCERVL